MKHILLIGCLVLSALCGACKPASGAGASASVPASPAPPASAPAAAPAGGFSGKVVETMNTGSYTYVLVDTGLKKLWVAAPQFAVKVGDAVTVADGMGMPNYHSKTLNRTFDVVYFTGSVQVNGQGPAAGAKAGELPKGHPPITGAGAKPAAAVNVAGIKKAEGGKSIAEIFAGKAELKSKQVKVRGKVVKYNGGILGKNWLHIQDGTGTTGSNDLTVTTASETKVGDTVLVTGTVATDRDFGAGYKYNVIIEDAKVKVE